MPNNPFTLLEERLERIESLLLELKQPPKTQSNKLYSANELAAYAGVSTLTIRNWIKEGKIKAKKIGRKILIEENQFKEGLKDVKSLKYKR